MDGRSASLEAHLMKTSGLKVFFRSTNNPEGTIQAYSQPISTVASKKYRSVSNAPSKCNGWTMGVLSPLLGEPATVNGSHHHHWALG